MSINEKVKDIYALAKKAENLDLQERIMDLREEILTLEEENLDLKKRIKALEDDMDVKENLDFDVNKYWKILPDGKKDGPFCQRCSDADTKLIRLLESDTVWRCHECRTSVRK
jgi:hypothetical protein